MDRIQKLIACGLASEVQMDEAGQEFVVAAKSTGPQVLNYAVAEVKRNADGSWPFPLSSETPDRRGDVVKQAGLDFRNFARNNVVLLNHNSTGDGIAGLPVGIAYMEVRDRMTWMHTTFSQANPIARVVEGMVEEGTLKASSISMLPKKIDAVKDKERREEMGLGKYGVVYEAAEVLEGSVVTLPMNPEAVRGSLKACVEKHLFSAEDAEVFERGVALPTERDLFKRLPVVSASVETGTLIVPDMLAALEKLVTRIERATAAMVVKAALTNTEATRGVDGQQPGAPGGGQQRYIPVSKLLESLNAQ